MIKIKSESLNMLVKRHYEYVCSKFLYKLCNIVIGGPLTKEQKTFFEYLYNNRKDIVTAKPKKLYDINTACEDKLLRMNTNEREDTYTRLNEIFDYESFSKEELREFGYTFVKMLKKVKYLINNTTLRNIEREIGSSTSLEQLSFLKNKIINLLKQFRDENKLLDALLINKASEIMGEVIHCEFSTLTDLKSKMKEIIENSDRWILEKKKEKLFDIREGWGPYQLVMELDLNVCPYCNRQYISAYYSKNGKTRGDLDHFFPKKKYPYLALSFYNLIPSCKVCNSSLKNDKDFTYLKNIHPYEEGFEDRYLFTIKAREKEMGKLKSKTNITRMQSLGKEYDLDFLYGNSKKFDIAFKEGPTASEEFIRKAECNAEIFKLRELYSLHKDCIQDMIKKSIIYNESRISSLMDEFGGKLFDSEEEILNLILGAYVQVDNMDKRPFSKFIRDISRELGLNILD
ncbi:HNH endonuclease [Bacillus cereus]